MTATRSRTVQDQPRENERTRTLVWGLDVEDDIESARALKEPSIDSLPERVLLGKILFSLRQRGVSQARQCEALELPRSRVTMLQRIGSFHSG